MLSARKVIRTPRYTSHLNQAFKFLRKQRVLIADDDPETASLLTKFASEDNYEVVVVHDGAAAYRVLRTDAGFCAAIINLAMPQIQGVDILRYMKTEKRLKRIPVVILTGDPDLGLMIESFSAGALAFFHKPCASDRLWRMVRTVSERAAIQTPRRFATGVTPYQSIPS